MPIYMGPYNDPLDATVKHHWDTPHAPDCRNPALQVSVTTNGLGVKTFHIDLSVRNSDASASAGNFVVLYGSYRLNQFTKPSKVDTFISNSIFTATPPILAGPFNLVTIPGRISLGDATWVPPTGTVLWTPGPPDETTQPYIFVIVATVAPSAIFAPTDSTVDSQVAVWVGP